MHKDLKKYIKELHAKGWTHTITKKAVRLRHPSGKTISASLTPSCPHFMHHVKADVKRVERELNRKTI
jgi:hypothetical protein